MSTRGIVIAVGIPLLLIATASAAEKPTTAQAMSHLRTQHPRLLVLPDQLLSVRAAVYGTDGHPADPVARAIHDRLRDQAQLLLTEPVNRYTIGGSEHTLLSTSRSVEGRVMLLAGMYRLDHDRRFADRAIAEIRAAAAFPDWYPEHFLDTAEMTAGLGTTTTTDATSLSIAPANRQFSK
jgi:hypothetical protein